MGRTQRLDFKELKNQFSGGEKGLVKVRAANPELLMHEQKRKVELDLMKLEDELRTAGMGQAEIEENLTRERAQMTRAVEQGALHYETALAKKDSHQLALDKQKEMAKFEKALGINAATHSIGAAFDQELQAQLKLERMEQRAQQEAARLEAAKKAEKAQQKAEKLREKAEKAKQKAEAKLAKLKAKQEKRRMKKEKKEAGEEDAAGKNKTKVEKKMKK